MRVGDLMTASVQCCTANTPVQQVAALMLDNDCGLIPVVDDLNNGRVVGVVTDRDIVVRLLATGRNPLDATAADAMSGDIFTCTPQTSVDDCCSLMEERQVRRIPVVDEAGKIVGIVAQADVARQASKERTAEVVREVSQPGVGG
jgi:CBS domain-containing protein